MQYQGDLEVKKTRPAKPKDPHKRLEKSHGQTQVETSSGYQGPEAPTSVTDT